MGNPFVHIELSTSDLARAKKFYKAVFDWKLTDMPMGAESYTMLDVGKGVGGGMQRQMAAGAPSAWLPYVEVADVKKTMAKAAKNGARVMVDFMEVGGMGALGIFADPTGGMLGVWQTNPKPARRAAEPTKKKTAKSAKSAKSKKK